MHIGSSAAALCAALCVQAATASGQVTRLALADVISRAREQAPQVVVARLAVDEARGRLRGASLRFPANPEISVNVGNRSAEGARYADFEVGVAQALEPPSRRAERMAGADAAIARASADVEEVRRLAVRSAAEAYYRAVHAEERIRLLATAEELAAGVLAVADRRFRAGDIAVLDVNVSRAALARVRADRQAAEAARALALGDLKQILRLGGEIAVEGRLERPPDADLSLALQTAGARPELRALEAAIREAEADARLGGTFQKPEYAVGAQYAREEGDHILLGGLRITLPVFSQGQELRAVGAARAARLRVELDAARARAALEVQSAFEAYRRRLGAVNVLEADAMPGLDENDRLMARSFEVGQIGLPDLLLIRREILETRAQYLEALLEAVLARVDLDASAGALP